MQKAKSLPNLYNLPKTVEVEFEWDYKGLDLELGNLGDDYINKLFNNPPPFAEELHLRAPRKFYPVGHRKMLRASMARDFYNEVRYSVKRIVQAKISAGYDLTQGDLSALMELERQLDFPSLECEDINFSLEKPDCTTVNVTTNNRFAVLTQDAACDMSKGRNRKKAYSTYRANRFAESRGANRVCERKPTAIVFTPRKAKETPDRNRYRTVRDKECVDNYIPDMVWMYTRLNVDRYPARYVVYGKGKPIGVRTWLGFECTDDLPPQTWLDLYKDASQEREWMYDFPTRRQWVDDEGVIPNVAPPPSPKPGCSFWDDDLSFGELTPEEKKQESLWAQGAEMIAMVKNHITDTLYKLVTSFLPPWSDYVPLISSFVSSIISCLTSIVVFATQTTGAWVKALLSVNIITSLTAFITSLGGMLGKTHISYDADAALTSIPTIAGDVSDLLMRDNPNEVIPNALTPLTWVRVGITTLVAVLLAGLGLSKTLSWRELANFTSLAEGGKKLAETVTQISKFIMEETLGLQFDHDHPACKELETLTEEGARLIGLQPATFVSNPQELVKLRQFLPKIVSATAKKVDKDSSQRYNTIRQLLVTQYRSLLELEKTINAILVTKPKQATVAVVFSGNEGVGKSEFAKYLSNRVCDTMSYPRGIYSLNKRNEGFYEPYGGQRCAIYNEWMALRSEDPLIKDFNLIFSTDPMNFEGAALDAKVQPNQLAVGFLTANVDNPVLTKIMNEGAAKALWDRTLHIKVIDPKCRGRQHANLHRQPDFSHLKFQLVQHGLDKGGKNETVTYSNISFKQIEQLIIGRIAMAESQFTGSILEDESLDASVKGQLETRRTILQEKLRECSPYLEGVIPNALGREFFSVRLQGIPGCGKSTLSEYVALTLGGLFSMPVQVSQRVAEFKPIENKPYIYILDDWVEGPVCQEFLEKINQTHPRSIYVICSNTVYKHYTNYKNPLWVIQRAFSKAIKIWPVDEWDATATKLPDGVLRRIGLQGTIRLPTGQKFITPEQYTKTYTFEENFLLKNKYGHITNREEIVAEVFKGYVHYMDRPTDFIIVDGKPPITHNSPVTVRAKDQYTLIACLRSVKEIVKAYTGVHPDVTVNVDYMDLSSGGNAQTMVSAWRVYEEASDDPRVMRSVFSRMCAVFNKLYPNKSFFVECQKEGIIYYYYKGIGYIYNPNEIRQEVAITFNDKYCIIDRGGTVIKVDVPTFVGARHFAEFKNVFVDLTYAEVHEMYRQYDLNDTSDGYAVAFRAAVTKEYFRLRRKHSPQALWLKNNVTNHPVFWLGMGLLGMVAVGGAVYGLVRLIKWFMNKGQDEPEDITAERTTPNSGTDDSQGQNPKVQSQVKRLTGIRPKPNAGFDDSSGDNPKVHRMFNRLSGARSRPNEGVFAKYENHLHDEVVANMLSTRDIDHQPPSMIDHLTRKLRKSYLRVDNDNYGHSYGLVLKKDIFVTVAHGFKSEGEAIKVSSNGVLYPAKVIKIFRDRDLAICRVVDKKFPMHPNIRDMFIETHDVGKEIHGFFIRPGEKTEALSGMMTYYYNTDYPITAIKEYADLYEYNLKDKFLVFTSIALTNLSTFIKPGDCGFPLVALNEKNEFKVIGIHNAYNRSEKSYFSGFNLQAFDEAVAICEHVIPNTSGPPMEVVELPFCGLSGVLPTKYCDILDDMREERRFSNHKDSLAILGYARDLHFKSNPIGKHKLVDLEDMITPISKIPGAYTMDYVEDTSKLVTDIFGKPAPLFTQCVKYQMGTETYLDDKIWNHTLSLVVQDVKMRYGGCRLLRKHEVINGLYTAPLQPIDLSTSPGPYCKLVYKLHNKQAIFKEAGSSKENVKTLVFDMDSPAGVEVSQHYSFYMNMLLNYNYPPIILSKDCPKVENIDEEKAKAGKVRLFNEIDISINMVLKTFFGDWLSKIIDGCDENHMRLGQDPFITSTAIMRQFNEITGRVISTDFRAFDKTVPALLIYAFCYIAAQITKIPGKTQQQIDDIFLQIAHSLVYVIHTCNGTVYLVDRGNESGTFVTTMLNSVAVLLETFYTFIRVWYETHGYLPSLAEVLAETRIAILGDDRSAKVSKLLPVTADDFIKDSLLFGTECTPSKTETVDGIDFCSRSIVWDKNLHIAWPALKVQSIYAQLHWFATLQVDQILANLDNALMEAAIHPDPRIFEDCMADALTVLRHFHIGFEFLSFHSREILRDRFYSAVMSDKAFECISLHCGRNASIECDYDQLRVRNDKQRIKLDHCSDIDKLIQRINLPVDIEHLSTKAKRHLVLAIEEYTAAMADPKVDPVSAVMQFCQKMKLTCTPEESYDKVGPDHSPKFICTLAFATHQKTGEGTSKKAAKKAAYAALHDAIVPPEVRPNMLTCYRAAQGEVAKEFMQHSLITQLDIAKQIAKELQREVIVLVAEKPVLSPKMVNNYRYGEDEHGLIYVLSEASQQTGFDDMRPIYGKLPGTTLRGEVVTVGAADTVPNVGGQVGAQEIQGTMNNPGLSTIPHLPNPITTHMMPAMAANEPAVVGAMEPGLPVTDLNPVGPSNMLGAGAVQFCLTDMLYSQYLDSDVQYTYTDDTADGQIIFQIPYDPLSSF